jgi:hypothetical protein
VTHIFLSPPVLKLESGRTCALDDLQWPTPSQKVLRFASPLCDLAYRGRYKKFDVVANVQLAHLPAVPVERIATLLTHMIGVSRGNACKFSC